MSTYNYTISTDTLNAAVSEGDLQLEIQGSAIVTALDYVSRTDDALAIVFKASLSAGDETILDGLVAAHTGVVSTEEETVAISTPVRIKNVSEDDLLRVRHTGVFNAAITAAATVTSSWKIPQLTYQGNNVTSYMIGVIFKVIGGNAGDTLDFLIEDTDNVLGYGAGTVLDEFASDFYIFPDEVDTIREHRALLYPGLYLKAVYKNNGAEDATFVCNIFRYIDTE